MLVLSRKAGQRVHIGEDIVLEVRRVAGNRVTIALEAPRDVRILRGELQQAATEFEIDLHDESDHEQLQVLQTASPTLSHLGSNFVASEMIG